MADTKFLKLIEKQNKNLSFIYRIALTVNKPLDLKLILNDILQKIVDFMAVDAGVIYVIKEETLEMIPVAFRNLSDEVVRDLTENKVKIGECMCGNIAQFDREIIIYEKASEDVRFTRESIRREGIEFYAGLPLKAKGKVVGVLCVITHEPYTVDPEILDVLRTVVVPIGLAIENARIFENAPQKKGDEEKYPDFKGIISHNSNIKEILKLVKKILDLPTNLIIYGETGTGKEVFARAIHFNSIRKDKPFVPLDCGALSETLLESELFGYLKGSFTGAFKDKKGFLEVADGGTLLLDEVNSMSHNLQIKLLRFLQEKTFSKVGSTITQKVDVRIIAATNQDLKKSVEKGMFREDLYHRLNVISFELPPLRERKEDILLLSRFFLHKYNTKYKKKVRDISENVFLALLKYSWPGNIRELQNTIEHAVILAENNLFTIDDLPPIFSSCNGTNEWSLWKAEKEHILRTLSLTKGDKKKASELLEIDPSTLWRKLQKYNNIPLN